MADIGTTLREARMRARIDITEVELRTKIRAKYLRALENEEWDLLPGPVYAKSFLRTYGDFLGLDSRMLVDDFKRRYERPSDHELRPIAALRSERERAARGPLVPPWAVIGLVLVAIVAALAVVGIFFPGSHTPNTATQTIVSRTTPQTRTTTTPALPVARAKPRSVTLELAATGRVYVCVVNGAGAKLIPGVIFDAGQAIPAQHATKLLVTLGNNMVQMKVNGKAVAVPASSTSIGFLLTPGSTAPLPHSKQPTCL